MRIAHIMLFMLLLNFSIVAVDAIGIYRLGAIPYDVGIEEKYSVGDLAESQTTSIFYFVLGQISFSALGSGIIIGSLAHWGGGVPGDKAFVYGFFLGTYVGSLIGTLSLATYISGFSAGIGYILWMFVAVSGVLFVISIMQIVVGGWKSFI